LKFLNGFCNHAGFSSGYFRPLLNHLQNSSARAAVSHAGEIRSAPATEPRRAAKAEKAFPGTVDCCPTCKSPRVHIHGDHGVKFYSRQIAICANCRTAWEPIDASLIWDASDPCASLSAPCDNCAFRPGSPEQSDTAKWKELIAQLRSGAAFHCHKGVPLDPEGEDGFAYPKDRPEKLRLCRGYLNALGNGWGAAEPDQSNGPGTPQP
jgi:hypothetical protein